ncbi:MAG: FHA domain-containing protein [Myxococcota bacterium]
MLHLTHRLGIDRRNLRSLSLLPLVEVAWADGKIQPRELDLIRTKAEERALNDDDRMVLENWLKYTPSPGYLRAGRVALAWARQHGDPGLDPDWLRKIPDDARAVAAAAGGLFGIGAVCRAEREALTRLVTELDEPVIELPPDTHPDFTAKGNRVTLAFSSSTADEGPAVLEPMFDVPMRLPLNQGETWVGTGPDCDVRLIDDPEIAGSHCVIERSEHGFLARALDGAVWLNGERVEERRLLGGEIVRISPSVSFVFKHVRPFVWDDALGGA